MLPLLLIPATFLTVAYFYQSKGMSDKKKIATFFEIAKICVQHKDELQYPIFIKEIEDDISMNYVYKLPLAYQVNLSKNLLKY